MRLVKTSNYIQRFELKLRYKLKKTHIIFDALSRFVNINVIINATHNENENELNAFFITAVVDLNEIFLKRIMNEYTTDFN